MTLIKWRPRREWDPFSVMEHLQNQINRAFNSSLSEWPSVAGWGTSFPAADVFQDKDNVIVTAELPGLGEKDLDISITGNTITLKGEKKQESEVKEDGLLRNGGGYHRVERSYGSFQRVIELPVEVNADKAKAKLANGVLTVTLPKSEAVKPKQITVDVK
jgi:HSP20 family protein